jgi:hypothetical protein
MFSKERERLLVSPEPATGREANALAASYNFVLETA